VAQQRSALRALKDFAGLFGLDPSSRSKLHAGSPEADELEEFLDRPNTVPPSD
jgi:phage terminase small subunit